MSIFEIFKKKVNSTINEIQEISVLVKEYKPTEEKKFIDIDMNTPHVAKRKRSKPLPQLAPRRERILVKINLLPILESENFMFIDYSRIDGYPVYEYVGDDPSEINRYPYEEIHATKSFDI